MANGSSDWMGRGVDFAALHNLRALIFTFVRRRRGRQSAIHVSTQTGDGRQEFRRSRVLWHLTFTHPARARSPLNLIE